MFSLRIVARRCILYLYKCPIQGIDGAPGAKGDNGEPGKAVSVGEFVNVDAHSNEKHSKRGIMVWKCAVLAAGTTRGFWRTGTSWTTRAEGACSLSVPD